MTPQDKAKELVDKFRIISYGKYSIPTKNKAKQCALIAVDEILDDDVYDMSQELFENRINYWEEVKQEIEKL